MHRSFDKIRQLLPVSVVALSLGACAATSPSSQGPQVTADSMIRVADMTRGSGDLVNAVGLYQRAHEVAPDDVRPLLALGQIFTQLGSPASAAEAFRAAIQVDANNVEARRGLATALIGLNQPEQAIAELEMALDMSKDYRLYNSLGVAYDMIGDQASAQTYYKSGLELSPGNLQIINNLGLSLVLEGRYPEAIALLEPAAADRAATPRLRQNLALAIGLAGDRTRARELAGRYVGNETAEKNLSYFSALKGLDDERTMAAALGVHLLGAPQGGSQILPAELVPAAAAMPAAISTPVAPTQPVEQGTLEVPVDQGTIQVRPLIEVPAEAPAEAPVAAASPHHGAPAVIVPSPQPEAPAMVPSAQFDTDPFATPSPHSDAPQAVPQAETGNEPALDPTAEPAETDGNRAAPAHQILPRDAAQMEMDFQRAPAVRPAFGILRTETAARPSVTADPLHRQMASIYVADVGAIELASSDGGSFGLLNMIDDWLTLPSGTLADVNGGVEPSLIATGLRIN